MLMNYSRPQHNAPDPNFPKDYYVWYSLVVDAWRTRGSDWIGLSFDPRTFRRLNKWTTAGRRNQRWEPLEERAAISLVKDAITWVETIAPLLTPLLRKIHASRTETLDFSRSKFRTDTTALMKDLEQTEGYLALREYLGFPSIPTVLLIHKAMRLTQGAALTLILFLCGTRVSEAANLSPNCLTQATHSDGFEYAYIQGG